MRKSIGEPRRHLQKQRNKRRKQTRKTYRLRIIGVGAISVIGIIAYVIATYVIYSPRYHIAQVQVTHGPSSFAQEETITAFVRQMAENYNSYFGLRFGGGWDDRIADVYQAFPLIEKVQVDDFSANTLELSISYHEPKIIRHLPNSTQIASYGEYLYPLAPEYVMTGDVALLYLPGYLSQSMTNIDGVYHETSEEALTTIYHAVNAKIPLKHMIVYPGAGYVAMKTVDDIKVLFSLRKPVEEQLEKYGQVYRNYPEARRIQQIDVGSLDDVVVTLADG